MMDKKLNTPKEDRKKNDEKDEENLLRRIKGRRILYRDFLVVHQFFYDMPLSSAKGYRMKASPIIVNWHNKNDSFKSKNSPIWSVDFLNFDSFATGAEDGKVMFWRFNGTGKVIYLLSLEGHDSSVNILRFSPNKKILASAGDDKAIIIWKEGEGKEKWVLGKKLISHISEIYSLTWSSNGKYLFTGSMLSEILFWDVEKGNVLQKICNTKFVQGLSFDPLGVFLSAVNNEGAMKFYVRNAPKKSTKQSFLFKRFKTVDRYGKKKMFSREANEGFLRKIDWSPDGEFLAVASAKDETNGNAALVFSRSNLVDPLYTLGGFESPTSCVRWSGILTFDNDKGETKMSGQMALAVASRDEVLVYGSGEFLPIAYFNKMHYACVSDLAWSLDGRLLLIASLDGYCSCVEWSEGDLKGEKTFE